MSEADVVRVIDAVRARERGPALVVVRGARGVNAVDEFIADARAVTIGDAAQMLGLKFIGSRAEHPQPCPQCGGRDTFAFNTQKNVWNCRQGGAGGHDAIGMAAHCLGLDLHLRSGFHEACASVTGRPVPTGAERESDEDRGTREKRLAEARRRADQETARREGEAQDFRERERAKARGIYEAAEAIGGSLLRDGRFYLRNRGCGVPDRYLRIAPAVTYWHGKDDGGRMVDLHCGPAMIAPFVDAARDLIGCHITWIDLSAAPKFRPDLRDPATGEALPSKKMRGSKKGGLIPLAGSVRSARWVGGEGIENGLAFAGWEGFRADTFYFAAGDLGNLAGPADASSRFAHPTLTKVDKAGRTMPVMVPGSMSLLGYGGGDAIPVGEHVDELVLLGDGDSEPVFTAAAMTRARKRHARPGRSILTVWPKRGSDFAGMAAAYASQGEDA